MRRRPRHGHRGSRPANGTPDAVVASVVWLARTRYEGANHTHLSELLKPAEMSRCAILAEEWGCLAARPRNMAGRLLRV